MYQKIPLKPYPTGWYVLAASNDLKKGGIIAKKFCGNDIVVFRTASGKVSVSDAYCPHMGAHFAHGGTIEGELIKCPFHHFCFDTQGACVATGYGTKPSPRMKLTIWHSREKNGFIIVWYDEQGYSPAWEIPDIDNDGFSEIRTTDWNLRSHPQETTENSVDLGHFSIVHGYTGVDTVKPLKTDAHYLTTRYKIGRKADFMGSKKIIDMQFDVHVWGLGYSFVEVDIPEYELKTRQYVFPVPIEGNQINLKAGMSIKAEKPGKIFPLLRLMPHGLLNKIILNSAFKSYCKDVSQDFKVWENKIYIDPPALAKGDGPVAQYRLWCRQFYKPEITEHEHSNETAEPVLSAA
jgi:nitrite reductase/ring-hydroxylating ferredoxin subunit